MSGVRRDIFAPLVEGAEAVVFWNESFEKVFNRKGAPKDRAKVEATIRRQYAQNGPRDIPKERLNTNEGRHTIGHTRVMLWAFKSYQLRVYCVEGSYRGKRAIFISVVDPSKKQDAANQGLLKRAAQKAVEFANDIDGAEV